MRRRESQAGTLAAKEKGWVAAGPLQILSGSASLPLAQEISQILNLPLGNVVTTRLPDSETHVQLYDCVRGADVFVIQSCSSPVNDHVMELFLLVDALRRASAARISAVIPYFPYARQDRMAQGREAISAKVIVNVLETLGVHRVIAVDLHNPAIQGFFNIPVDPLTAVPALAGVLRELDARQIAIVAPDVGRARLAGKYAALLGAPLVVMHKRKDGLGTVSATHVVGEVADKIAVVIDDIIAGGSMLDELPSLIRAGAREEIYLAISHPVLVGQSLAKLQAPYIKKIVVSNTINVPPEKRLSKMQIVSVAPLLAEVIKRIHQNSSIGSLLLLT